MIKNYNLIRSILQEPWFISSEEAKAMGPYLLSIFNPERLEPTSLEPPKFHSTILMSNRDDGVGISQKQRNIAVIEIYGALTKYGTWCNYGMEDYGEAISRADRDRSIDAIILKIDSPGGTVSGTEELGEQIRNVSSKPIIAFVSDMACSAAYWIASCCDEIIANNTTATIGSIGVMCTYHDMREYFNQQGIIKRDIYSSRSKDKNEEFKALERGEDKHTIELLDVFADKFISIIKSNRPNIQEKQLTGKVYFAQETIGTMIDGIGNFEAAVDRAVELISTEANHLNEENMSKEDVGTLVALIEAAGVETFESVDDTITLSVDQAKAVNKQLEEQASTIEASAQTQTDLESAHQNIIKLEAEIIELKKEPGADGASVSPETDADDSVPEDSFKRAFSACSKFLKNQ